VSGGRIAALAAALIAALCIGMWLGGHPGKLPETLRDPFVEDAAALSAEAAELIEDNYFRSVPQSELGASSLRGMVRGLRRRYRDRFSSYLSPQMRKRFDEEISGRFSGIGISVTAVKRGLRADRVFPRSPADDAGIAVGDVIVSVNGRSISGESSEVASERIKGPEGSEVRIGVVRPPGGGVRQLRLTREQIALPVASGKVETVGALELGYVRLFGFSTGAHAFLRREVRKVERGGAKGIVLDLRGNGGGLLQEAVLTASVFLSEGEVVVSTRSRTQGDTVYRAMGDNLPARPLVVLIDRGTASAAEALAAALADRAGATVVGGRSFGKGVFQQEMALSNGGALTLTIGEYFTPSGANLGGEGIRPDVPARDLPGTARDEGLERALEVLAARQDQG
jgi:carboxyl-terminal processing protease